MPPADRSDPLPVPGSGSAWALGARAGATAWFALALVEGACGTLVPRLGPWPDLDGLHPALAAALLVALPLAGAILGAILGAALGASLAWAPSEPARLEGRIRVGASATVVVALLWHLFDLQAHVTASRAWSLRLSIAQLAAIGAVHAAAFARPMGARLRGLASPWITASSVVPAAWAFEMLLPSLSTVSCLAILLVVQGAIAAAAVGLGARRSRGDSPRGGMVLASVIALHVALLAWSWRIPAPEFPKPRPESAEHGGAPKPGPNVLLVTLDTVSAEHLSLHGYEQPTTPELERFARAATVFERANSPAAMTLSAHASLFTGLHPSEHGAHWDAPPFARGRPLDRHFDTLAELLAARGYSTAAVVANHGYLGAGFGLRQGFEFHDSRSGDPPFAAGARVLLAERLREALVPWVPREWHELWYRHAEEIVDESRDLLESLARDPRPFFLLVNTMDAHDPYLPPEPWRERFARTRGPAMSQDEYFGLMTAAHTEGRALTEEQRLDLVGRYDAGIAYQDAQLVRLFDKLRELGRWDETLVIVTSDHGESFGRRNLVGHGISTYQDQLHVPLVIKFPGQGDARRETEPVSLLDLFPTIVRLAGATPPANTHGVDLLAARPGPRVLISENHAHPSDRARRGLERSVMRGDLKLVRAAGRAPELYDLARDPEERVDLAGTSVETTAELGALLDLFVKELPEPPANPSKSSATGASVQRRLEHLGYTGH